MSEMTNIRMLLYCDYCKERAEFELVNRHTRHDACRKHALKLIGLLGCLGGAIVNCDGQMARMGALFS